MKRKALIGFLIVLLVIATVSAVTLKDQACFWLDENGDGMICYEKSVIFNNDSNAKKVFADFVAAIRSPDGSLENYVSFSSELEKGFGGEENILKEIRKAFSWLELKHLAYILEDDQYSALLLTKGANDNYVLFLSLGESKFKFSYDVETRYLPVDAGWVNNGYTPGLRSRMISIWHRYENSRCLFRKQGVLLFSRKLIDSKSGEYLCDFKRYQLSNRGSDVVDVRLVATDRLLEMEPIDYPTIKFIKWISN